MDGLLIRFKGIVFYRIAPPQLNRWPNARPGEHEMVPVKVRVQDAKKPVQEGGTRMMLNMRSFSEGRW
jgi:hypothetical protein